MGLYLFPTLDCAVPLKPGAIMLFSGVEFHSGMALMPDANDISEIPFQYKEEIRLSVILYPKLGILNGRWYKAEKAQAKMKEASDDLEEVAKWLTKQLLPMMLQRKKATSFLAKAPCDKTNML